MSSPPQVRRVDKVMSSARINEVLSTGYCGHLATTGADGFPYVCPLLFVWLDEQVWVHNTSAQGHLQGNIRHDPRACFEVAKPGKVFAYGRYQCDTSLEYQSVMAFGHVTIVSDTAGKTRFFDALMAKYYTDDPSRPKGSYPRLDGVTVYVLTVERVTGKETALPAIEAQWPATDRTKSPGAALKTAT